MKMKDVEKLTGLTSKSIRFYESKGLIDVKRNEGNDYREYNEENVMRLKRIKLYRYLDFSIEEIKYMLDSDDENIKERLQKKCDDYSTQVENIELKRNMCISLSKEKNRSDDVINEYNEAIEALDEEDFNQTLETIKDLNCPTLTQTIAQTLICLGPIGWLFINIYDKKWDMLVLNSILAILASAWITWIWKDYLKERRIQRARMKRLEKQQRMNALGVIVGGIIGFIIAIFIITNIQEWMAPDDWLFYEKPFYAEMMCILGVMVPFMYFSSFLLKKLRHIDNENELKLIKKYWLVIFFLWFIMMYIAIISVTFVTKDQIIYHSPLLPQGITYGYNEVTQINTGFGQKKITLNHYQKVGTFYYTITVNNNKITFSQPSINESIQRYDDDTYLELEEFDQALMKYSVLKEGNDDGYQNVPMDDVYINRFRRIINNK